MYVDLDFWRFFLGLLVVSVPAVLLERSGEFSWADRYVVLILLMLLVTNWRGVQAFQTFIASEMRG